MTNVWSEQSYMRRVILESPYTDNVAYARACVRDCLQRGDAPFASHLLYTQSGEAELAGLAWGEVAKATVVYVDRGVSAGMKKGIAAAEAAGRTVEYRRIDKKWIITDFEFNEQVLVPAGDGEPAQWKRKGDLTLIELARHVQGVRENVDQQKKRVERYEDILPFNMSDEEEAESSALHMAIEAWRLERKRRQAAIDREIAAGRCRTWSPVMTEKDDRWSARQPGEAVEFLDQFIGSFNAIKE